MQHCYLAQASVPTQHLVETNPPNPLLGSLLLTLPVLLAIGILAHHRRRTLVLQQKVALLEKLWVLDASERSS
jgi:hypothetical protein